MDELMFTSPMHQDIGSASMFRMYPGIMPGMGMYGGMYYGANVQGPGPTRDKFELVNSKRTEGKITAKKAILGTAAAVLSIIVLKKLPIKKANKLIKSGIDFVAGWAKWCGSKILNLLKKIPSAPKP